MHGPPGDAGTVAVAQAGARLDLVAPQSIDGLPKAAALEVQGQVDRLAGDQQPMAQFYVATGQGRLE